MMRKSFGHKDKYANKYETSQSHSNDGTAARTRPFSYDEIMLRRKNKKQSGSVEDQHGGTELISGKGVEGVSGRAESDRHRHGDVVGSSKQHASMDSLKVSSRMKEDKSKTREAKIIEDEPREYNNAQRKSKVGSDNARDRRKERGARDKGKNHDGSSDDSDSEYGKRHGKDSSVKDRDRNAERNRGKSEHVSKRRNQNGYDERTKDWDAGKKHESRKWHDPDTYERKQKKKTSESHHEDLKLKSKRSRSREHDRDKSRRSNSPSPRGRKQRVYDLREHEEFSSHSSKDKIGRFDSNADRKRISNNGSSNKSKRHDTSASKLGGYSPRKRRSEAAVKTPSPTGRSPEKKSAGWDSPPVRIESKFPSSFQSDLLSLNRIDISNKHELSSVVSLTSSIPKPAIGVLSSIPTMINASVDSIQLTQATRPKRRLYVENLPTSASEVALVEWLNRCLRSSGVNHVQGASPCISCIVNKEKGQALVEFLTPEDASAALGFDGKSFSGNILKIRRPKDYVEASTGVSEKPVAAAVSVRNIVEDSPNKIFIGGISKVITSEMLMEIASAFGPLKAYHFEFKADLDGPCAFVEYADQSVTVKACAGLNGMKLGGQDLTVTRAIPDVALVENLGDRPFYGIPVHARPLLEEPTQVLKLNNVLDTHSLSSLSELELEEILEDVRLECARFGMVKSINIIKHTNRPTRSETGKVTEEVDSMVDEVADDQCRERGLEPSGSDIEQHEEVEEPADGNTNCHDDKQDVAAAIGGTSEPEEANGGAGANRTNDNKCNDEILKDETCDTTTVDSDVDQNLEDSSNQISSAIDQLELNGSKLVDDVEMESKSFKLEMVSPGQGSIVKTESHDIMEDEVFDLKDTFEPGCVLVEYKRAEASSMAAHCLHGRIFDGRIVSVGYVAHDVYHAMFHK